MVSKTLTYENFEGETITETAYFNLSKGELVKLDAVLPGGLESYMKSIVARKQPGELVRMMDKIIGMAYGVKNDEGLFIKPTDRTLAFMASDAYYALIEDLYNKDGEIERFIQGIMPKTPEDHKGKGGVTPVSNPVQQRPNIVESVFTPMETEEEQIQRLERQLAEMKAAKAVDPNVT